MRSGAIIIEHMDLLFDSASAAGLNPIYWVLRKTDWLSVRRVIQGLAVDTVSMDPPTYRGLLVQFGDEGERFIVALVNGDGSCLIENAGA